MPLNILVIWCQHFYRPASTQWVIGLYHAGSLLFPRIFFWYPIQAGFIQELQQINCFSNQQSESMAHSNTLKNFTDVVIIITMQQVFHRQENRLEVMMPAFDSNSLGSFNCDEFQMFTKQDPFSILLPDPGIVDQTFSLLDQTFSLLGNKKKTNTWRTHVHIVQVKIHPGAGKSDKYKVEDCCLATILEKLPTCIHTSGFLPV